MADVILFHHALGLTDGLLNFARQWLAAGHRVTVPDLYEGKTFDRIEAGVAHAELLGFNEIIQRGIAAAVDMPARSVFAGFSLGVLPAQKLAQTRGGALGAMLFFGAVPAAEFSAVWPDQVSLVMHLIEHDQWSELDVAKQLARDARDSELFVYPGSGHLVTESNLSDYDPVASQLMLERSIHFLNRW